MSGEPTDVLVLGTGVAGCAAALAAARGGASVTLVTRADQARESNTYYAQGGIVARPPGDTPEQLAADIERAGDGLCSPEAVALISREGPDLVQSLLVDELGVPFDRDGAGFHWTLEGAHSVPRVLHVKDATGAPIERALIAACRQEKNIRWLLETTAVDLLTLSHDSTDPADRYRPPAVIGAYLLSRNGGDGVEPQLARETILATGGLGQVYLHTTNPPGARGDGFAMARRAGARLLNLEYIQFHPTALVHPKGRLLLTEALRGEGARITDIAGRPFLQEFHPDAELAPRDVVARAIHQRMLEKDEPHVLLDISHKHADWIRGRFPELVARCREYGFDLTAGPVPVVPAAHYSCGGVAVDARRAHRPRPPAGRRRGLVHRRPRRQPPRLDLPARGPPLGLEGRTRGGARGRAREDAAPRPGAPVGARARARRSGPDRPGLDGHPPHDVELRRPGPIRAASGPRGPHPRRAPRGDRELLPPGHDVGRPGRPAQRRPDGARHPPGRLGQPGFEGVPLPGRRLSGVRLELRPSPLPLSRRRGVTSLV